MTQLPVPSTGRDAAEQFVSTYLSDLTDGPIEGSLRFAGGRSAARKQLDDFDVSGFSARMDEVTPQRKRAASALSPYLRYGLLSPGEAWTHVEGGPALDVEAFRQRLLWQEYAKHWYSRLGAASTVGTNREQTPEQPGTTWNQDMACLDMSVEELEEEGWLVGRSRSWLASYWSTTGGSWRDGEDFFFRHLIDGSRASNRLGWQTAIGLTGSKPFFFNRWQVEKWAAGLCASCEVVRDCPIEAPSFSSEFSESPVPLEAHVASDIRLSAGPPTPERRTNPTAVWLTAESLGLDDPALAANPELPAVFVFDEPLLAKLRLSPKRLVFIVETLAELAESRTLELWLGSPVSILRERSVAVTFAPVPGFRKRADAIGPAELYPWPWFIEPTAGSVVNFREWRRSVGASSAPPRPLGQGRLTLRR